ncbi:MAG TPA: peptidylprolyl isomerase, partial [Terrimesophilobacter sp.]|nr:peptidylprolyl isomerase [Terrimesophilobacter sp.]
MARSKSAEREARMARERLRTYSARQQVHNTGTRRRQRDNITAIIATVAVVALVTVAQFVYFSSGPGAPVAVPSAPPQETQDTDKLVGDIPSPELAESRAWSGQLTLNDVTLDIELDGTAAPQAVAAFVQQVNDGYFIDKTCHRL